MAAAAAFVMAWSAGAGATPMIVVSHPDGTVEDAIMRDGTPDSGFQSSIVVRVANWEERGIAEFNIGGVRTAIGAGATFNSVRLELTPSGGSWNTDAFLLHAYGYTGNGVFELGDFSQGTFIDDVIAHPTDAVVELDVSAYVLDMLEGADNYVGINLRGGNTGFRFGLAQFLGGPDNVAPRLVFDYTAPVPEPASLALLGFGLAALGAARRRRRQ